VKGYQPEGCQSEEAAVGRLLSAVVSCPWAPEAFAHFATFRGFRDSPWPVVGQPAVNEKPAPGPTSRWPGNCSERVCLSRLQGPATDMERIA